MGPRVTVLGVLVAACGLGGVAPTSYASVCEQANGMIEQCGASVPFLTGHECTGLAKVAAKCITEHSTDCDSLATLSTRLDECMPDAGDTLYLNAEDIVIPVTHQDAGFGADAGS